MDAAHPHWDHYAEPDDLIEFMKPFRDSVWMSADPAYTVKSGFVMPGMDNRGCAGWGGQHFYYIPRDEGRTYERMWEFSMASRDSLDMVFIASWSDYTEGHEIEPTVENGDRELRTTLHYAARSKRCREDASASQLPARIFDLAQAERIPRRGTPQDGRCRRPDRPGRPRRSPAGTMPKPGRISPRRKRLSEQLETALKNRTLEVPESELRFSSDAVHGHPGTLRPN